MFAPKADRQRSMNSKVTYRQQYTRCGKQRCRKCREGAGHGPYWYAYWSEKGRTVSKYIGSRLPEDIAMARRTRPEVADGEDSLSYGVALQELPSPVLRVYLLGQFRVERKNGNEWSAIDSRIWHRRRARALLGCLLSSSGRRLSREQVMELLWPDLDIDIAANRLNGAVHELRQILEPEISRPAASRMLRLERDVLEIADSSQIWVDAEAFESLLKDANNCSDPTETEHLLEDAASLYRGSYLLEELYSEWAAPRRDALQRAWIGLLLGLANLRAERGALASAIETLDRLRTAEPTNETALQRLMVLLTRLDRRGEALQVYRQHIAMLERDYENDPLPETHKLYEELRQGKIPPAPTPRIQVLKEKEALSARTTQSITPELPLPSAEPAFSRPVLQLGRHNQSPLIGRHQEIETMRQVMLTLEDTSYNNGRTHEDAGRMLPGSLRAPSTSSRSRRPHLLLLIGEPGIGKTRLAEELSLEAYTRDWAVAWSRSYEQEGTIPYRPWTELLRTLLQGTKTFEELINTAGSSQPVQAAPFKLERLSPLLPELVTSAPAVARTATTLPHEQERLHLWEATLGLLATLSTINPLLLVFDDLHWADDSSIELLTYLTHHLQDQRVLLLATCRDAELPPQHKLRTLIADLQREQAIVALAVQPLTQSQIGTLVSHLPQDVVQSIQTQAAGNPFFAEELARYMGATYSEEDSLVPIAVNQQIEIAAHAPLSTKAKVAYDAPRAERLLPEAIAAVLERRLGRLSSGCQALMGRAAVLGGSFELNQLLPITNEHTEDTILDLLDEALYAGLLTEEGTGTHITYHFWHPLIISHLYERLSAARRAQLHRKAAEAIKIANGSAQPEKVAAAIVYHLSKGGGNPIDMAYYAELAGNQAYSIAAYSEAQQYYLQTIQAIVGKALQTPEGTDIHTHIRLITPRSISQLSFITLLHVCRLLEQVAECSIVQGNYEDARYLYECILDLRTGESFQQHLSASEKDSKEQTQQEAQIQAILWREISNTWSLIGEYARAYDCNGRGREVLQRIGVATGAAWACLHMQYGSLLRFDGNYQEARRYVEEALEVLEQVVQPAAHYHQAVHSMRTGRGTEPSSALYFYEDDQPQSEKKFHTRTERRLLGDPLDIGYAHEQLGIIAASAGPLSDGLRHMNIALTIYEQNELVSDMTRVCNNLGAAYIVKSEQASARTYLRRSLELAERIGDLPSMTTVMGNLGDVAQRSGDLLESEEWFKRSIALAERINDREGISWCCVELATVQQDLGKLEDAKASLLRAISIGRAIKSLRCVRYALVGLGDLRIIEALLTCTTPSSYYDGHSLHGAHCKRLLQRARSTIQRAIALDELEVETIIDGRYLLASIYFFLDDLETAHAIALQALKEAQENEIMRMTGRAYRLLGRVLTAQKHYEQADDYFEQAIHTFRERELRLDYARALHYYGVILAQRGRTPTASSNNGIPIANPPEQETLYRKGLDHLHEARRIFVDCHATIDLAWVERVLTMFESR